MNAKSLGVLLIICCTFSIKSHAGQNALGENNWINSRTIEKHKVAKLPDPVRRALDGLTAKANKLRDTEILGFLASLETMSLYLVPIELIDQGPATRNVVFGRPPMVMNATELFISTDCLLLSETHMQLAVLSLLFPGKEQKWISAKVRDYFAN